MVWGYFHSRKPPEGFVHWPAPPGASDPAAAAVDTTLIVVIASSSFCCLAACYEHRIQRTEGIFFLLVYVLNFYKRGPRDMNLEYFEKILRRMNRTCWARTWVQHGSNMGRGLKWPNGGWLELATEHLASALNQPWNKSGNHRHLDASFPTMFWSILEIETGRCWAEDWKGQNHFVWELHVGNWGFP